MDRKQRVIIGFAGIVVSMIVGAISVKGRFVPGQVLAMFAGILLFIGAYKAIFFGKPPVGDEESPDLGKRDVNLEHRLADIQEIVISIDERLRRIEQSNQTMPQDKPEI